MTLQAPIRVGLLTGCMSTHNLKKRGGILKKLLLITFLLPSWLFAQVGFLLSPPKFQITLFANQSANKTIDLKNVTGDTLYVETVLEDFFLTPYGKPQFKPAGVYPYSCSKWIQVNPVSFLLLPHGKKIVRFTVTLPGGSDGDYLGVITFKSKGLPKKWTPSIAIYGEISVFVHLISANTGILDGDMEGLSVKQDTIFVTYHNTGNVRNHIDCTIEIKSLSGKTIWQAEQKNKLVLRNSERILTLLINKKLRKGTYNILATIDYGGKELIQGERKIHLK